MRRFIKKRTTGNFRASGNFHEATLHQGLQHSIDAHSPDGFDIGTYNRLAISNDCERLEGGRGQARRFGRWKKLADPPNEGWVGDELPAFGFFSNCKSVLLLNVFDFQLLERCRNFRFSRACKLVRRKFVFCARALDRCSQFTDR